MLERIRYINNNHKVVEFGKKGIYANENDLRDYIWTYDTDRNKIGNFRKTAAKKTIPIVIKADTEENAAEIKNNMFKVFEYDVLLGIPGKLLIGEYYMECYIVESCKSNYINDKKIMNTSIKIASDTGNWIKKTRHEFIHEDIPDISGRGYPYEYKYDYSMGSGYVNILENEHFASCDFIMKISGYAFEPSITIGGHVYKVNETIQINEILTINSKEKTIILTKNNGIQVNLYSKREKSSYIFEKISPGENQVYWNSGFNFEITLFEERSEPKWT